MSKAQAFGLFLQEKYSEALESFRALASESLDMQINAAVCAAILKTPDFQTTDKLLLKTDSLPCAGLVYLAELFLASENPQQALKFADAAIKKNNRCIQAYLTRLSILEEIGDGDEIMATIEAVFPTYKHDERILCAVAGYATDYGRYGQAKFLLRKALKQNRLYTLFRRDFYDYFSAVNLEKDLLPYGREAFKIRSDSPDVLHALATASALVGNFKDADKYFTLLGQKYDPLPDQLKSMWADALFGATEYARAFDLANSISDSYGFKDGVNTFMRKALYLLSQVNYAEAIKRAEQWRKANPDDVMITHCCAAICGEEKTPTPPTAFAQEFFDAFAYEFEDILIGNLKYQGDELLETALREGKHKKSSFQTVLDAGCGTGLLGPILKAYRKKTGKLIGVDVSGLMLDEARKKIIYDALIQQDLRDYLSQNPDTFDLIACMDVFSYIGDLTPVFKQMEYALTHKGIAIFCVLKSENGTYSLQKNSQYKHTLNFTTQCLDKAGLKVLSQNEDVLRYELDKPEYCFVFKVCKK